MLNPQLCSHGFHSASNAEIKSTPQPPCTSTHFPIREAFTGDDALCHFRRGLAFQIMSNNHQIKPTQLQPIVLSTPAPSSVALGGGVCVYNTDWGIAIGMRSEGACKGRGSTSLGCD